MKVTGVKATCRLSTVPLLGLSQALPQNCVEEQKGGASARLPLGRNGLYAVMDYVSPASPCRALPCTRIYRLCCSTLWR